MIEVLAKISSILNCIIKYILKKMYVEKKSQGGSFYNIKLLSQNIYSYYIAFPSNMSMRTRL